MTDQTLDLVFKVVVGLLAFGGAVFAWAAKRAVQEVKVTIDGRLQELLDRTAESSRAEGRDSMRAGDGLDAGTAGPVGPAGIQGPAGPQGQVGPQGATGV